MPPRWFDAHLDLAYLAETGRDMHAPLATCRGRFLPASITLPSLAQARVTHALATIFTEPAGPSPEPRPWTYTPGDPHAAWRAGMRQLKLYHAWRDAGVINLFSRSSPSLLERRASSPPSPRSGQADAPRAPLQTQDSGLRTHPSSLKPQAFSIALLLENADPIPSPDDLPEWADAGVTAIGMAWATGSRYASGNAAPPADDLGLTPLGRALADAMDALNITHDLSHLSPRAVDDLLSHTTAPVIATHCNCRALMGDQSSTRNQRHLTDAAIREIARRGGVIGITLYSPFLRPGIPPDAPDRATIDDVIAHIEHACEVVGDRRHVGLGSDADGGFAATRLPAGIDTPADYHKLADALAARNWPDEDITAFAFTNWATFFTPPPS